MPRGRPHQNANGAASPAAAAAPRGRGSNQPQLPFAHKLVLNRWLLSLFSVKRFEDVAERLRNEALEGLDENSVHHFHHALTAQLFNLTQLPTEMLLEYDQNIVNHTITHDDDALEHEQDRYARSAHLVPGGRSKHVRGRDAPTGAPLSERPLVHGVESQNSVPMMSPECTGMSHCSYRLLGQGERRQSQESHRMEHPGTQVKES